MESKRVIDLSSNENSRPLQRARIVIDLTDGELKTREELLDQHARDVSLYAKSELNDDEEQPVLPEELKMKLSSGLRDLDTMPFAAQPELMKTKLLPFQLQGLAWMIERENQRKGANGRMFAQGGILADEMGLGKTLQAIGLICSNPAPKKSKYTQTLISVPMSCLDQWFDELKRHAPTLSVLKYYGSGLKKSIVSIMAYDVILTTHGIVQSRVITKEKERNFEENLCKIRFWRVIIDEAHVIRNPSCKTHKAVLELDAENRWCLSGTPIQNSSMDVVSLLRFLRDEATIAEWRGMGQYCRQLDHGKIEYQRELQDRLRVYLLRRNKRSEIHGKPIFEWPKVAITCNDVPFEDDDESLLYNYVMDHYSELFAKIDKEGLLAEKQASVFAWIVRLRQLCLHPLLFVYGRLKFYKDENGEYLLKSRNKLDMDEVLPLYREFVSSLRASSRGDDLGDVNPAMVRMISFILANDKDECSICMEEINMKVKSGVEKAVQTRCKHIFHDGCLKEWLEQRDTCPLCRAQCSYADLQVVRLYESQLIGNGRLPSSLRAWLDSIDPFMTRRVFPLLKVNFGTPDLICQITPPDLQELGIVGSDASRIMAAVERLTAPASVPDKELAILDDEEVEDLAVNDEDLFFNRQESVLKSTKLGLLVHTLEKLVEADPTTKILVFSQFTTMLDLVQSCLCRTDLLGGAWCRLDGSMKMSDRSNELALFSSDPSKKVFLLSLKAACLGLNLTSANKVILLDPWFNPSVEAQAIDRVVRIGQKRDVTVLRLFIKDTIEDRMRKIAEAKQRNTDSLLNEDSSKGLELRRISVSNIRILRALFQRSKPSQPLQKN